ncbi:MAG: 50S ribosome-binding GTPase [Chloroflexi bacterium]|nr:50S ribosome-binding GTPase [Chloroflexota bacterium]
MHLSPFRLFGFGRISSENQSDDRAQTNNLSVVLVGLESTGKSAIFRGLTGHSNADESNFRGSSVTARRGGVGDWDLWDTPGIRLSADTETTQAALAKLENADVVAVVVQATNSMTQMNHLLDGLQLVGRRALVVLTFADKVSPAVGARLASAFRKLYGVPTVLTNSRRLSAIDQQKILDGISSARPLSKPMGVPIGTAPVIVAKASVFEMPYVGPGLAIIALFGMFALPVYIAFTLSSLLEPLLDAFLIVRFEAAFEDAPHVVSTIMIGRFGLLTLGWYSLLWAFPVVLFIGLSVALADETGLKDRITAAVDKPMRRIGLSGRDLVPVITGFGCNVVAVVQSRSCSSCNRRNCVTMITFASACSYQIGATLSVFNATGHPWLFLPYIFVLFIVGAIYTRLFSQGPNILENRVLSDRAFFQRPSMRAVTTRTKAMVHQFVYSALPIFYAICVVASVLSLLGIIEWLSRIFEPVVAVVGLPTEAAMPIIMSTIRKDGILLFQEGEVLSAFTTGQLFVGVYIASTLTACLVTLWTVRRELGLSFAGKSAARQFSVALVSGWVLARVVSWISG